MASRRIEVLQPDMQILAREFEHQCEVAGLDVVIYCTLRPHAEQARLFRQGRPFSDIELMMDRLREEFGRPDLAQLIIDAGPQYEPQRVTNAGPGMSLHGYGYAFDAAPIKDGKGVWETDDHWELKLWQDMGNIGVSVGLEWGGNWEGFTDMPHFQMPDKSWRELIRLG